MKNFNLCKEIRELRNQLSYSKNIGFFFGAGTSCSVGIPNIKQLTIDAQKLLDKDQEDLLRLNENIRTTFTDKTTITIEDILNHVRQIADITGGKDDKDYSGISGATAMKLNNKLCRSIYQIISEKEEKANIYSLKRFFTWLNMQNKDYTKEVFTTNYDLLFERALESIKIPYFDGFVGTFEPFFWQDSVDRELNQGDITKDWIRIWKLHGSLNWTWKYENLTMSDRVVRTGKIDKDDDSCELVIYPSKEKYSMSRKQPYIVYFDRLRNYLTQGELLFIFSGFSFSDMHINEIIFNSLIQNNRLFVIIFLYTDQEVEALSDYASTYINMNVFGPTKAIINGILGEWTYSKDDLMPSETPDIFWNETDCHFTLGSFNNLVEFLIDNSGKKQLIEDMTNGR